MPYADANGIRIAYEVVGADRPGTPLVMTHGFAGPSRQWRPELVPLAEKRPLVIYDVRGHDRTTVPPDPDAYSLPTFASDLAGLLDAIGIERAHIGGVSMGGMITAQFKACWEKRATPPADEMIRGLATGFGPTVSERWDHHPRVLGTHRATLTVRYAK